MICDISNAYPSNIAVDAEHNVQFQFVFFGDGCKEADFILYDSTDTTSAPKKLSTHLYDDRRIYFNGEEIDVNSHGSSLGGQFVNGRSYVWKVRMYEDVNISQRVYPSVRRTSGEVSKPCFFFGTIQSGSNLEVTQIPIEKSLDITLPMWMRIGEDTTYRIVNSYDPVTGICVLKNPFDSRPEAGAKYSLSSVKSYVPKKELDSNQIFIEKNITELTNADFTASGKSYTGYCWYMEINNIYTAITGYDPKTGIATLEDAAFSTEEAGTKYNIWTSFIDSKYYAINTKQTPYFTSAIGYADGENILFEAELAGTHLIKYYWLDIYEDDVLVETTKQIRMAKLSYYFKKARVGKQYHAVFHVVTQDGMTNQEDSEWWKPASEPTNVTNKCKLISVSDQAVGGAVASFDYAKHAVCISLFGIPVVSGVLRSGNVKDLSRFNIGAGLDYTVSSGQFIIFENSKLLPVKSYSKSTGELIVSVPAKEYFPAGAEFKICSRAVLASNISYRILRKNGADTVLIGDFDSAEIYDYTCALLTGYRYIIQPHEKDTQNVDGHKWIHHFYNEVECPVTAPIGKSWAIYELASLPYSAITNDDTRIFYPYQDTYSDYRISKTWLAALDIDTAHQITHNINKVVYSGNHLKPVAVSGSNDYDTFSLSFTIGNINCPDGKIGFGTIKDIDEWKAFVARGSLVMLKDPDGGVWVGAITSNSYEKIRCGSHVEYKVTFEFTELKDADSIVIRE